MGSYNSIESQNCKNIIYSVFLKLSDLEHDGKITGDQESILKQLNTPIKINIDINTDDSLTTMMMTDIEIAQDIRVIFEETQPLTCYWIRTEFYYLHKKDDDHFTNLQVDVINLGIQEANNKLRYPVVHNGKIYSKSSKDMLIL
uniref:Uncharacterized protein n=1 Tax=viral metagenome TaxID=1070528 RepID=A0A6C0C7Y5_9ZZZZ